MVSVFLMAAALQAAPVNDAWVVVSQRSGVPGPRSLELAQEIAAALTKAGVPSATPPADLSECKKKKPCLVEKARAKGVTAMVLVEIGSVLGDGFGSVEAISVDEFGKRVATVSGEAPDASLKEVLSQKAVATLTKPLKELFGLKDKPAEPVKPPEPPKVVVTEPPPPVPPVVVADPLPPPPAPPEISKPAASSSFFSTARIIGVSAIGAGVLASALGAGFLADTAAASKEIDTACGGTRAGCASLAANRAYSRGYQSQGTAVPLFIAGGVLALSGLAVVIVNPGAEPPPVAVSFFPGGAAAVFSTVWP
ncbi:MAG: hypothetical protein GQE15_39020 [Archangiaceae bacterium]|nr:hypothetical protein [Archangiaceae bacterium]